MLQSINIKLDFGVIFWGKKSQTFMMATLFIFHHQKHCFAMKNIALEIT